MMALATIPSHDVELAEGAMLAMPQAEIRTYHHFGEGVYIRELQMPAGTFALGHEHKHPHLNVLLQGVISVPDGNSTRIIRAPCMFDGVPGRKVAAVLADVVWLNILPNPDNCRDISVLDSRWVTKSKTWEEVQ